jgi:hypothetical protein
LESSQPRSGQVREDIFQKRIKGATDDALDFLKKVEKDVIKLNLQLTAGQITKEEFDDLMQIRRPWQRWKH